MAEPEGFEPPIPLVPNQVRCQTPPHAVIPITKATDPLSRLGAWVMAVGQGLEPWGPDGPTG